jgi:hypothetical protein
METQIKKKSRICKYPVSAQWTENNVEKNYATQLYQIGVYIIFNNDSASQGNMSPSRIAKLGKSLKKAEESGKITNLTFGREIRVSEKSGFWEEVREEISNEKNNHLIEIGNSFHVRNPYRKIDYKWQITAIDNTSGMITFSSDPVISDLGTQVTIDGANITCSIMLFKATIDANSIKKKKN